MRFYWPYEPRFENTLDTVLALQFMGFALSMLPLSFELDPVAACGSLILPGAVHGVLVVRILKNSFPLADHCVKDGIEDDRVRFRVSNSQPTRAIDVLFARYIVLSRSDLDSYYENWRGLIHHEHAHLINRDTRFFHFVSITALLITGQLMIFVSHAIFTAFLSNGFKPTEEYQSISVLLLVFILVAFAAFAFWVRGSLHRREYNADAFALANEPEAYRSWLFRASRRVGSNRRKWWQYLGSSGGELLDRFSHPRMHSRLSRIDSAQNTQSRSITGQVALSLFLLLFCVLAGFTTVNVLKSAELVGFYLLQIVSLFLIWGAYLTYFSTTLMLLWDTEGYFGAAKFSIGLALAIAALIAVLVVCAQMIGALTLDQTLNTTLISMHSLIVWAAFTVSVSLALVGLARVTLPTWRFNPLLHFTFGSIAVASGWYLAGQFYVTLRMIGWY